MSCLLNEMKLNEMKCFSAHGAAADENYLCICMSNPSAHVNECSLFLHVTTENCIMKCKLLFRKLGKYSSYLFIIFHNLWQCCQSITVSISTFGLGILFI